MFKRLRPASRKAISPPSLGDMQARWQPSVASAAPVKQHFWTNWSRRRRWTIAIAAPLAVLLVAGTYIFLTTGYGKFSLRSLMASTIKSALGGKTSIQGESSGRTNTLIYGMTLDGLRTDSIMLTSYYWQQKKIVTLNIPRDLYVYDGYEYCKMGEVYSYAKAREPKNPSYPDEYVAQVISKEYGIPVNYWVQFDMRGEIDLVNAIGGVDVNVPVSFTDYEYPTWNYSGYIRPAPSFKAGKQHMNGPTSLIYSRSRHSLDNNQGTDFARSQRQAQVIQAVATKMKSLGVIGNVTQISHYLHILGTNVTTSMSTDEIVSFARTLKGLNPTTDYIHGNWATGNGFLCDAVTRGGADIVLYGQEGSSCSIIGVGAGYTQTSTSRKLAIYYVQNLLSSAQLSPTAFVTIATHTLWPTPTPSSAQPAQ